MRNLELTEEVLTLSKMKCAAILSVAVVMMFSQGAESLLGVNLGGEVKSDAGFFQNINANCIASLDSAIELGAIAKAQVLAILGIKESLFNKLWAAIDTNVNGRLDLDELIDLELMIYIEGLLDIDVDLANGAQLDVDINLTGASEVQCKKYMSAWWSKIWATKRTMFSQFFKKREQLKRRLNRRRRVNVRRG